MGYEYERPSMEKEDGLYINAAWRSNGKGETLVGMEKTKKCN